MKGIIQKEQMNPLLLEYSPELWHAPVGAYLVKKEAGIDDQDVLTAIEFHTSGRPDMTLLEKSHLCRRLY
ncbi:hypothetical protein BsIDN1_44940 [Bacillus safensis]|uniref:HD domain-containing protein n=1 Tax=Bacillus safensis TaxID=561879 RepID=A0A5S9MGX6_BACIA|nr:hypothetical protein BsIDN1_44940 [Bacillus safensis]